MKKRINLFQSRKIKANFSFIDVMLLNVKLYATIVASLLFVIFIILTLLNFQTASKLKALSIQKDSSLTYLLTKKDLEVQLRYFKSKQSQVTQYYQNDTHFLTYYKVLSDALLTATNSPSLDNVVIDKNRNTNFVVSLPDFDGAVRFLQYVESSTFLNRFNELVLIDFNLLQATQGKVIGSYKFTFSGTFAKLNEDAF